MDTKDSNDAQLHKVAIDGNLEEARTLILNGANIEAHCFRLETSLHKAAFNGNLEIVEFLIQKGANVKDALHFAASKPIAEILFKHGVGLEVKRDSIQQTPLHNTVADGFTENV